MPSLRGVNTHAAWCSNYEFEDVVRQVDSVDVVTLEPAAAFQARRRVVHSLAWRKLLPALSRLNPGVRPVRVTRDYDLFLFVCMNAWDLPYLNAIQGWQERCRTKICFIVEFYTGQAERHDHLLRLLQDFDLVIQSFGGSVTALGHAAGRPCHHLPVAVDALRFTPYPQPPRRVIDVLSIGRRSDPTHRALLRFAAERDLFYVHDTLPGGLVRPIDPVQHRDMLANTLKRSRFFVTYPAKFGEDETGGQSEVGARYFEGLAAGAVLLGQRPGAPSFDEDFPWPDAVVGAAPDGSNLAQVLSVLQERIPDMDRLARRNALHGLRHHDWAHRWSSILQLAGMARRPALEERLRALEGLAAIAEHEERCA